jgi:hypothetical protein
MLSLLLQTTPDTVNYMLFGFAVLIGLPLLYIASWFVRRRNLERDLELIRTLEAEKAEKKDRPAAPRPAVTPGSQADRVSR